jgi:hypothetical protein
MQEQRLLRYKRREEKGMGKDSKVGTAAVDFIIRKINSGELAKGKNYVYVSFSEKDKEQAYEVMEKLLKRGIPVKTAPDSDLQKKLELISNPGCQCMVTLASREYVYDVEGLLEQYARFLKEVQLPCLVIDLSDDRCKYKDDSNEEIVKRKKEESANRAGLTQERTELLRNGLKGLYQTNENHYGLLIDREVEAVEENDPDEIRRQMSFILDYDGHVDNVANLEDVIITADNIIKKLKNQGADIDAELMEESRTCFREWGKDIYELNYNGMTSTIVRSGDTIYLKKSSMIKENPAGDRSGDANLKGLYREYITTGVITLSKTNGVLESTEDIDTMSSIEEYTLFVTGEKIPDCGNLWKKCKNPYTDEQEG